MNEMTLPSRHRIRNSSPGSMRQITLTLGHEASSQYWIFTSERGRNILLKARAVFEPAIFDFPSFIHCIRAPPFNVQTAGQDMTRCVGLLGGI